MGFFKIRNITSTLSKRDSRQNTPQSIDLIGTFNKSSVVLAPNAEFVFESNFLPVQLHKLRVENVISVLEISRDEFSAIASKNEADEKETSKQPKAQEKKEVVKKEMVKDIPKDTQKELVSQNEEKKATLKQQSKNFI